MTAPPALDLTALVRPAVHAISSYIPAKVEPGAERVIKLDMNESPYGPSPRTRAALAGFVATQRYPSFDAIELRQHVAPYLGVPVEQVSAGAGLDDVLNNLMTLLIDPGDEIVISEPTFGVYRALASLRGGVTVDVPLTPAPDFTLRPEAILAAIGPRTKLVVICDPNNPTGNPFDPAAVERVVANAPCLVAIDEAYAEFAGTTAIGLMARHDNVCVLRTMSKFAGLAGMRVGYGAFPPALMPLLWRVTPAFCNLSAASQAAAVASLADLDYLRREVVGRIVADRDALAAGLRSIPGVEPFPSVTNFILARLPVAGAGPVVARLAARGVHVRYFGNPALGLRDCLRVSIGTPAEHAVFLDELQAALAAKGIAA
ncbi:MAG: histidinol-phosphate transaminase [Chloroflexia bacterium]|nr:histidinol-phosphate transaminase [Chloroflexia bacterium]